MESSESSLSVAVVGGGLVGSLHAIYLAQNGNRVRLYEARDDMRLNKHIGGRSINLALSLRGQEALRAVGLEDVVLDKAIPMYGRMIHQPSGDTYSLAYGVGNQCLYSVSRRHLNELLLDEVEKYKNVKLIFSHKLVRVDFAYKRLILSNAEGEQVSSKVDFCFGCDGAFSTVRRQMDRHSGLNYSQDYTQHAYKELIIPPNKNGEYAMKPNYLHIWPRQEFMLIALPNPDQSFTATLFMPKTRFAAINDQDELLRFFQHHFPDVIPRIGQQRLVEDYFKNVVGKFVSVKCHPHYTEGALLLGDAAHAMVPFYGQGMNAGFEDCLVFSELLKKHGGDLDKAASQYSTERYKDSHAICDLALYNYIEMRSHVSSRLFLLRRRLDRLLFWLFPRYFIPLYSMVTFSRIPYSTVIEQAARQDRMVQRGLTVCLLGCILGCGIGLWLIFHPNTN